MKLIHFDTNLFLREYWQRRPLLIRNPWADWQNPLTPDELAGLGCEDGIEARLIVRHGEHLKLENGPFPESRFSELADATFTLLVQAVDQHLPEVAALIEPFRFVPDWRIDDVMVSYATDGGGVGPHFDQYDVFLVQGLGQRRWRVGPVCDAETPLQQHADLRLLEAFETEDEWVLGPGDILYIPPGYAHDGIGVGEDCMTYSIGFRAPSQGELVGGWGNLIAEAAPDAARYADPGLIPQDNPGEITDATLDRLHALALAALSDRGAFARWFGQYATTPKYPEIDWQPDELLTQAELGGMLHESPRIVRNPASRFSFIHEPGGATLLFADGHMFACEGDTAAIAERLCAEREWRVPPDLAASAAALDLLCALANQGSIAIGEED